MKNGNIVYSKSFFGGEGNVERGGGGEEEYTSFR
jgi:hypothetical protein